jgi:V/A-type H+-transporting ATPase subunit D
MVYQTDVKPTRSGLLTLRNRLRMARKAHSLLSMKREVLILEVTKIAPRVKAEFDLLIQRYNRTKFLIAAAYMIEGMAGMNVAAYSVEIVPEISISRKNVYGVQTPVITGTNIRTEVTERGYGLLGTTLVIDDLADAYEDLLAAIVDYSASESALKLLLAELERISRRVKALEFQIIPVLEETEEKISQMHDEIEREETNRLHFIKKKKKESSGSD